VTAELPSDYEDLTECGLTPELEQRLVSTQRECVFMWTNASGEAFGVVMSYLPKDGTFWLTAAEHRKRIAAIRRFPRASICINSTGTKLGPGKTVTYKGACTVHTDRETKDWFYPEFSQFLYRDPASAAEFQKFLDSPHRVVIEFVPDYSLSFDGVVMWQRSPDIAGPARSDGPT
jgi:general stress protein 26